MKVKRKGRKGAWLHAPRANRYGLATPKSGWTGVRQWDPSQHKRILAGIFVFLLTITMGGWLLEPTNPLLHGGQSNPTDPLKFLFVDCIPLAGDFATLNAAFQSNNGCQNNGGIGNDYLLSPNSTFPAIALDKTPLHIAQAASKVLEWDTAFAEGSTASVPQFFEFYLTRNSTLPLASNYDPAQDPSVALLTRVEQSGGVVNIHVYTQLKPTETISKEDGGCPYSGSVFMCYSYGNTMPTGQVNEISTQLNFTGVTNTASVSVSNFDGCFNNPCTVLATGTAQQLPQLQLTGDYWWGFWESPKAALNTGMTVYGSYDPPNNNPYVTNVIHALNFAIYTPNPPATQPSPFIDTSGFFGPIIQALVPIGVFVLNAVLTFLGFIVTAIRIGLNAVGNFAGWGNIGDSFINELSNLATLFGQAGTILGWMVNGVSLLVQYVSVIANGFASWMTNVCCGTNSFFGPGVTFSGFIFTFFGYLVTFGPLPIVTFDFVFFLLMTGSDGLGGFASWWQWNKWMVFLFIQAGITLVEIVIGGFGWLLSHIPTISSHLPPKFNASFTAQTGQGIGSAPAFRGFSAIKGKFGGVQHGGSIGFGAIGNLAPDSLLLWMGGLFIFWQYLGSSISPLPSMLTGLSTGCAPRACINSGVNAITPLLGLWIMMFMFLFFDYVATSVGFGLVNGVVDDGGVKLGVSKSTRKLFGRFGKKAKRFVGEAMDAKGVKEMGKEMKAATRKEIHAVQITTSKAVAGQGVGLRQGKVTAQQRFRQLIKRPKHGKQHP